MATARENRICAGCMALVIAVVWALCVWGMGVAAIYTASYGHEFVKVLGSIYYGYGPSWGGAFIGMGWAAADGFIGTLIIVSLYNLLTRCCRCRTCRPPEEAEA